MSFLKRLFAGKEVKAALRVIDESEPIFRSDGFFGDSYNIIKAELVPYLFSHQKDIREAVQNGRSIKDCVYTAIATIARNHLVCGEHHVYQGILNPIGPAPELHRIFKKAVDMLVLEGSFSREMGNQWKTDVQKLIQRVG